MTTESLCNSTLAKPKSTTCCKNKKLTRCFLVMIKWKKIMTTTNLQLFSQLEDLEGWKKLNMKVNIKTNILIKGTITTAK